MGGAPRPPILTRALLLVFAASFGAMTGFYLLLSVVPLYAGSVGAGGVGAGLVTGTLMAATVAGELAVPRLLARFGYRVMLAAGLVLLGAPALALPASSTMAAILRSPSSGGWASRSVWWSAGRWWPRWCRPSAAGRGWGCSGSWSGCPGWRRCRSGSGWWGGRAIRRCSSPGRWRRWPGWPWSVGCPGGSAASEAPVGVLTGLRTPALVRPAVTFSVTAMAAGVVVTFLPLAVTGGPRNLAAVGLFVQAVASTTSRWWAGRFGDRHGPAVLLVPGVVATAAGMLALVLIDRPAAVVAGMALFGSGFGVTQNASMTLMLNRVAPSGYGTVSAIWNLAFDAGIGVGAFGFGVVAAQTGYPAAFAATAALVLAALVPLALDRAHRDRARP